MKGKRISHVQLHKAVFIPNYGELTKRTLNQQFYPGIQFEMTEYGVYCEFKGKQFLFPWVLVECISLEDAAKETPSVKKAS